jgi:hypothetical protein
MMYSRDIQEAVLILVFFIDAAHQRGGGRQHLIDEDEDGLFRAELNALADHVDELAHGQVGGYQVFLLVNGRDVGFFYFFADDLWMDGRSVRVRKGWRWIMGDGMKGGDGGRSADWRDEDGEG